MNCIQKDINILNYYWEFEMGNTNKIFISHCFPSLLGSTTSPRCLIKESPIQFVYLQGSYVFYLNSKGDILSFAYKYGIQKDKVKAFIYPCESYEEGGEKEEQSKKKINE